MESSTLQAKRRKDKRVLRIRRHISGTSERPRLCVVKSNQNFSVQVIDDLSGKTLVSLTTASAELKKEKATKTQLAKKIGEYVAQQCSKQGITKAVLDRRGSKYHGVIAAFADAARDKGLQF